MAAALAAVIVKVKQTRLDHNCNNIIMEMEGYIIDMASVTIETVLLYNNNYYIIYNV